MRIPVLLVAEMTGQQVKDYARKHGISEGRVPGHLRLQAVTRLRLSELGDFADIGRPRKQPATS
jgi:hypothetical protein